jgi:hypothetical protein
MPGDSSYAASFQVFGNRRNPGSSAAVDWDGKSTFTATFKDGTANTVMFAEKLARCDGPNGSNTNGGTWWMRGVYNASSGSPGSSGDDSYPGDRFSPVFAGGAAWNDGTVWSIGVLSKFIVQPKVFLSAVGPPDCDKRVASSPHPTGIMVAMGDGSVKYVNTSIDANLWWAALTPDSSEPMSGW